jgi:hypothetical protein
MACGVLELCLIATKFEGFKSLLPKYGMLQLSTIQVHPMPYFGNMF